MQTGLPILVTRANKLAMGFGGSKSSSGLAVDILVDGRFWRTWRDAQEFEYKSLWPIDLSPNFCQDYRFVARILTDVNEGPGVRFSCICTDVRSACTRAVAPKRVASEPTCVFISVRVPY